MITALAALAASVTAAPAAEASSIDKRSPISLGYTIYFNGIPPECHFSLTGAKLISPNSHALGYIIPASYTSASVQKPIPIRLPKGNTLKTIGYYNLYSDTVVSPHAGDSWHITFAVACDNGYKTTGRISIDTDDWGIAARPNHASIAYTWDHGTNPRVLTHIVKTLAPLPAVKLDIMWDTATKNQLAMILTDNDALATKVTKMAFNGVLTLPAEAAKFAKSVLTAGAI